MAETSVRPLGISEGLDLTRIDETTPAETDENLISMFRYRRPLYELAAASLMSDYAPDFRKLHRWGSDLYGRPNRPLVLAFAALNLYMYVYQSWDLGILNSFHTLRRGGLSLKQLMEIVMFSQLVSGMRGLGLVYRSVGDILPLFEQVTDPPAFPPGWAADAAAFKCGLDLTTRDVTPADRAALTGWYEKTIGYVPNSIAFGLEHHPEFVKINRAKWEVCFKTLPKQFAPFFMLRFNTILGSRDGLKEAALLGKAWGITPDWIAIGITGSAFYNTGIDGLYVAHQALEEVFDAW